MSEIYKWLESISNGLHMERLSEHLETRGFRTISSLKYLKTSDLDVIFPSPQKLTMAERRIIECEVEGIKNQGSLEPRELFPTSSPATYVSAHSIQSGTACTTNIFSPTPVGLVNQHGEHSTQQENVDPQAGSSQTNNSYLNKRESDLKEDGQLLQAQIQSVTHLLEQKVRDYDSYVTNNETRQKQCSLCHVHGHTKAKCSNGPCKGVTFCKSREKHPEIKGEIQELKKLLKDLEKRKEKSKTEYDVFKAARERAASSFFAVMRPRLRKQNHIRYVDRSALDKDLLILKKALGNKVPVEERMDWELPYIIERYKRANVDIYNSL